MSDLLRNLSHPFVLRALLAACSVAILCATISFFVVLRRMAFLGAGIAHISFAGVALALVFGFPPTLGAAVVSLAAAAWISLLRRQEGLSEDTAIGISFAAAMGFGVICVSLGKARNADLMTYFFGNVLTVRPFDLWILIGVGVLVIGVIAYFFRDLLFVCFDEEMALVAQLPVKALNLLLFLLIATIVVLSIRTVGMLLVAAFLVIPGAVAQRLTERLLPFFLVSLCVGLASALLGLFISFHFDLPSGATMVIVASAFFLAATPFKRRHA